MMFFDGYIAAPPTILVISAKAGITYEGAARPIPAASAAAQYKILAFMFVSVDRSNRSLSRPPSIGVRVLRSGFPGVSRPGQKKAPNKNHVLSAKRRAKWERIEDRGLSQRIGDLALTSLSSALPARAAPEGRLIVRHSALVRVCHWVNAICFVVLLMSGMQIFNASPLLTWGQTTNFERPFFSLSARQDADGNATAGLTTIFG